MTGTWRPDAVCVARRRSQKTMLASFMREYRAGHIKDVHHVRTRSHHHLSTFSRTPLRSGWGPGVLFLTVTSGGEMLGRKVTTQKEKRKRRRLAKAVSRTRKGSKRSEKAKQRLRAFDAKQSRRRRDMTHKITTHLAKNHRVVVIEKLDVQAMTASARGTAAAPGRNVAQKAGLNRSVLDVAWGEIRRQLAYKTARRGGLLLEVPARNTSRTCPACGVVDAASRVSRDRFCCVACGHAEHADVSAAKEIRRRGLIALGLSPAGTVGAARGAPDAEGEDGARNREKRNEGFRDAARAA